MKNRRILITLIVLIMLIIIQSSCSLFPSTIERHLFFDSICWEDDNHILMYSMVRKWVNTSAISWGSETGRWDWSKGEIWRINVFTGEKELLLRREGDKYTGLSTVVKIDVLGDRKLISLDGNAYIMEGESTDWQEIEGIYEAEWINDNEIIGIDEENKNNIILYNIKDNIFNLLLNVNINTEYITHLAYNKINNKILISNDLSLIILSELSEYARLNHFDTLIINDSIIGTINYYKCYFTNDNTIVVMTDIYKDYETHNYLLEFDSILNVSNKYYYNENDICPRKDMQIFANMIYIDIYKNSDKIIFTDKLGNILSTVNFLLNQLDE